VSQRAEDTKKAPQLSACSPQGKRQAFFGAWRDIPVYSFDALQPGHALTGPAIIEAETTTVLVDTGDRVAVNALGWLDIELR
jgi:N-methylhydantoinase A